MLVSRMIRAQTREAVSRVKRAEGMVGLQKLSWLVWSAFYLQDRRDRTAVPCNLRIMHSP